MSYARFRDDSDVYVILNVHGYLDCVACALAPGSYETQRTGEMIVHLGEHRSAGHRVPTYAIEGLNRDWDENDAFMAAAVSVFEYQNGEQT